MNHKGTVPLETGRLTLRRFTMEDAPAMFANWASDPEVTRYLTWLPHADAEETRRILSGWISQYDKPDMYHWGLVLRQTGELIGDLNVVRIDEAIAEAELGWCMCRRYWGQGLMPEAGREVIRFLLDEAGFNRVCAKHDMENPKSGRAMQKAGMRFEGVHRQSARNNRGIVDHAIYAILKSDARA